MKRLTFPSLKSVEIIILVFVLAIIVTGFILYYTDVPQFEKYVREDGMVEWMAIIGLVPAAIVCFYRFITLRRYKTWWFLLMVLGLGLLLVLFAGEEISWGQRIFGFSSTSYFAENNSQGETNLHNLVIGGVKINRLIFSTVLITLMGLYLIFLPLLYQKNKKVKSFVDGFGIPIPRLYQVLSILLAFGITSLLPHEKKAELLETAVSLLFFLIIKYPANAGLFKKPGIPPNQ